ncbi:MAG: type II 3-dehydroquinate dehydratase [Bacteroidia bacterium]
MKRILIINGPNLNLLGKREPGIYGKSSFEDYLEILKSKFSDLKIEYFQSNIEGEIINKIHSAINTFDGIVINPGGYSHTSVAIADAIAAVNIPTVEVHISNVHAREDFRKQLITATKCKGVISGLGLDGYEFAIEFLLES